MKKCNLSDLIYLEFKIKMQKEINKLLRAELSRDRERKNGLVELLRDARAEINSLKYIERTSELLIPEMIRKLHGEKEGSHGE